MTPQENATAPEESLPDPLSNLKRLSVKIAALILLVFPYLVTTLFIFFLLSLFLLALIVPFLM